LPKISGQFVRHRRTNLLAIRRSPGLEYIAKDTLAHLPVKQNERGVERRGSPKTTEDGETIGLTLSRMPRDPHSTNPVRHYTGSRPQPSMTTLINFAAPTGHSPLMSTVALAFEYERAKNLMSFLIASR